MNTKFLSFTAINLLFVIILNFFNWNRNFCCEEFYESFLNHVDHAKHIIKQLCLTLICFYIFHFSHKKLMNSMLKICYSLIEYMGSLSEPKIISPSRQKLTLDEEYLIDNEDFDSEIDSRNDDIVYQNTTVPNKIIKKHIGCISFTYATEHSSNLNKQKTTCLILSVFLLISSIKIVFIDKVDLIFLWSTGILISNLIVISSVLIIRYFPYQIITDLKKVYTNRRYINELKSREEIPLVRQALNEQTSKQTEAQDVEDNTGPVCDEDGRIIEDAFMQHKLNLKAKAFKDKSLSFGQDQPSLISAYRSMLGYFIFILCSIGESLLFDLASNLDHSSTPWLYIIGLSTIFMAILTIQILIVLFLILKSSKETIYVKNLYHKTPYTPYTQLILSHLSIFFILKSGYMNLLIYLIEMGIMVILFLSLYKLALQLNFKNGYMAAQSFNTNSEAIFTIMPNGLSIAKVNNQENFKNNDIDIDNEDFVSTTSNLDFIS